MVNLPEMPKLQINPEEVSGIELIPRNELSSL